MSKSISIDCEYCKKTFKIFQCWLRGKKEHSCSKKCANSLKKEKRKKKCIECNKYFMSKSHQKERLFCSVECRQKNKIHKIFKKCEICDVFFRLINSRKNIAKYCSYNCHSIGSSKHPNRNKKGKNNPKWKGYEKLKSNRARIRWSKEIKERDNYICNNCGVINKKNHAHHILSFKDYPELRYDLTNGITLCPDCHSKCHENDKNGVKQLILYSKGEYYGKLDKKSDG